MSIDARTAYPEHQRALWFSFRVRWRRELEFTVLRRIHTNAIPNAVHHTINNAVHATVHNHAIHNVFPTICNPRNPVAPFVFGSGGRGKESASPQSANHQQRMHKTVPALQQHAPHTPTLSLNQDDRVGGCCRPGRSAAQPSCERQMGSNI